MEIWRKIDGLEIYEVSSCGRVRRNGTKYLSGSINNRGYIRYDLCLNGKRIAKSAHRLVADAFIPNPEDKPFINHIDGDRTNNNVDNLEWATNQENLSHAYSTLGRRPCNMKQVVCLETKEVFESCESAAGAFGVTESIVNRVCNGKRKTAKGFHFEFLNDMPV